jgi:hypothetical protein
MHLQAGRDYLQNLGKRLFDREGLQALLLLNHLNIAFPTAIECTSKPL